MMKQTQWRQLREVVGFLGHQVVKHFERDDTTVEDGAELPPTFGISWWVTSWATASTSVR